LLRSIQEGKVTEVAPAKLLFKDREEFRSFQTGEDQSFGVIAALYFIALGGLVLVWVATRLPLAAAIPGYITAFVVIGWAQYSLGNGMHEAVHHNLRNQKSDRLAWLLTAYPVGLTNDREYHLNHHRHLGTESDPDYKNYINFPQTKVALILRFVWFVSGIPAVLQFVQQHLRATSFNGKRPYFDALALIGLQAGVVALFWWVYGNPLYYFVFWALPVATVGKLLSTTRLLCEHGTPTRDWVVRTIDGSRWQTWLMGAFDFNYHAEHHLFPSIPYAQLHRFHCVHRAYFEQHPEYKPFEGRFEFFSGGYLALLTHWFHILPWSKPAQLQSTR